MEIEGFSTEHGIICVACGRPINADEKIVPVYTARISRVFFIGKRYVKGSVQGFPLFAHLRCEES